MTLVRYGQAALIAAIVALTGNAVWAQTTVIGACATNKCCKDGKCSKDGDCCCKSGKCEAKCSCCKDNKCACCKDGDCCCAKKCSCAKDKTSAAKAECDCCPFLSKLAKHTAIIMVMPASMPLPASCMEAMGILPHPPMPIPPGPHVFLPPPMPPMLPIPPTPSMAMPGMPPMNVDWCLGYAPCPAHGSSIYPAGPPCYVPINGAPASSSKFEISAPASSDQLEISIGEETAIRAKKMTVKIGDKEITVSRFDDRVRVRGEDLKATANSIRSDRNGNLILEGDVVLHCKKDSHATTHGDRIELDLRNCAMTIERAPKLPTIGITPVIHQSK